MITLVLALLAIGFLQISVTYRHALLFSKASIGKLLLVSFLLTFMNNLMAWVALLFTNAIRDTMFFDSTYAAMFILAILAFKAYFNTRRSKIADNVFDITQPKLLVLLGLATSFEVFIAVMGAGMIETELVPALIIVLAVSLFFSMLGFLAGRRPSQITSIRVFILIASVFYLLAALSTIYFLL
ncbi:MAG: manganese efflux pump [Bacteroidales bacterium]